MTGLKSLLIGLSDLAYERELEAALQALHLRFQDWKSGKINGIDLNEAIHRYHNDRAQELWQKYVSSTFHDLIVAEAVARGIINRNELTEELLKFLDNKIKQFEAAL